MTLRTLPWLLCFAACGGPEIRWFGGPTMGSTYEVKYVGDQPVAEVRGIVEAELAEFDLAFSNWREDSEIARCNTDRSGAPFPASARFRAVLAQALVVAGRTDGAFDPTVKPLMDLYRQAQRTGEPIPDAALAAARARVGWRQVRVDGDAVVRSSPDVQLDLDGIVAGAAADAIAERLQQRGIAAFYLQITGEVLCHGRKPDGRPWQIGVVDPQSDAVGGDDATTTLSLLDRALCTSGDYRNTIQVGGRRLHHIFDPRTGANAAHDVVSVSVLARSAALADALGTALMVLGEPGALLVAQRFADEGPIGLLFLSLGANGQLRQTRVEWPS